MKKTLKGYVEGFGRPRYPLPPADLHRGGKQAWWSSEAFYQQCHQFPQFLSSMRPIELIALPIKAENKKLVQTEKIFIWETIKDQTIHCTMRALYSLSCFQLRRSLMREYFHFQLQRRWERLRANLYFHSAKIR